MPRPSTAIYRPNPEDPNCPLKETFEFRQVSLYEMLGSSAVELARRNLEIRKQVLGQSHWFQEAFLGDPSEAERQARKITNPDTQLKCELDMFRNSVEEGRYLVEANYVLKDCHPPRGIAGYIWARRQPVLPNKPAQADFEEIIYYNSVWSRFEHQKLRMICLHAAAKLCFVGDERPLLRVAYNNQPLITQLTEIGFAQTGEVARPDLYDRDNENSEYHMEAESITQIVANLEEIHPWLAQADFA